MQIDAIMIIRKASLVLLKQTVALKATGNHMLGMVGIIIAKKQEYIYMKHRKFELRPRAK